MSRQPEKHPLFTRPHFFFCAIALVWGCSVAPSETAQSRGLPDPVLESTPSLESVLADDNVESATCKLELDCCGNLNCAPAPCPIFCL
jgi:hypothetical protein